MDENKKIREVRVIGYSRELLFLQLTILVCVFSLLGVALSAGWWKMLSVTLFLCLCGFSLFQVSRLHRRGVTISVCGIDDEGYTHDDEEVKDFTSDDDVTPADDVDTAEDYDYESDEPHWTDVSYPDPDIELGLKNPSADDDKQPATNENSDTDGSAEDETI